MDWGLAKVLASHEPPAADDEPPAMRDGTEVISLRDSDGSLTQAGSVLGTPAFMPPEQAVGAVGKVDARSDVFGLGAILAVILTGQPPFTAASAETTRIKAAQGKVQECFGRLDGCGADPELLALCKRCLAPERDERPADAGAVARAVAQLRAAADERARRAELERVRLEGEQAAAQARAAERRKRRRLAILAAAVLVPAIVGGLTAVLLVQRRANAELAEEQAKVEARFQTALKAIATFHTGVSEDMLLKNDQLKELRTRLLKEAAGFYGELDRLLEGQTDAKSRKLLADAYHQLGELTEKIGDMRQALVVQRQALALRRELAAAPGADVETRLDVARGLWSVGRLLDVTEDRAAALAAYQEQRDLAAALAEESPTAAVELVLGHGHNNVGTVLERTGKPSEALKAFEQARDIRRKLAEADPADPQLQRDLAWSYSNVGLALERTGKPAAALEAYEQARDIRQKLVENHPGVTRYQGDLAHSHRSIGDLLRQTGKPAEALKSYLRGQAVAQELADANPAVSRFQNELAVGHVNLGVMRMQTGNAKEALQSFEQARTVFKKLMDANPAVGDFQANLAYSHNVIGDLLARAGRWDDAVASYREALALRQKLAAANPTTTQFRYDLASSLARVGLMHRRAARPADAATSFREAIAILEGLPTRTRDNYYNLACYYALLAGVAAEPGAEMSAAEGQTAAEQAMAALRQAVAAGWRNAAHMKIDTDLDALRPCLDFQQLMQELEKKNP
jgi:tetratricopeptide (TPR) repeat protein